MGWKKCRGVGLGIRIRARNVFWAFVLIFCPKNLLHVCLKNRELKSQ